MTKFEQIGINHLYETTNKNEALRTFNWSCTCCCTKGMHIQCDYCAIAQCYENVVAVMDDKENRPQAV